MMDTIVQWATILSPIIAVLVAVWVVISSKKDTDKQIESIKALSKLQIEILATQIEMESVRNRIIAQQTEEERMELNKIGSIFHIQAHELALRDFEEKQPERNLKYTKTYLQELNRLNEKLVQLKKQIN